MTRTQRGPIDPRLWRRSAPARRQLVASVVLSGVVAISVIVAASAIGRILAGVITDPQRRTVGSWTVELSLVVGAFAVRVIATFLQARIAHRSAAEVIAELKLDALAAAARRSPRDLDSRRDEWATVITRGLDGLSGYLTGYIPALALALTVTPLALIVVAIRDPLSGIIVGVTLPLIPIFMILVGLMTRGRSRRTLASLSRLSGQLLDLVEGLPTLRALGRERGPEVRVRALGDAHRRTTMHALRVAFLSSMVLELLASLSVAVVAVSIGLRLVFGDMALEAGLVALILAPEVYLPLRSVGAQFHSAEDGVTAADRVFEILDDTGGDGVESTASRRVNAEGASITIDGLRVRARDGYAPDGLDVVVEPGRVTVLTGPNGSGKTTALMAVLGLVEPAAGHVLIAGVDVTDLDLDRWWEQVTWLPQRPAIMAGTVRQNLNLARQGIGCDLRKASEATGFDEVVATLPGGWDTVLGRGGVGLSLGERQRLALARTLMSTSPVLLMDEPTAHLDDDAAARVLAELVSLARRGRTVVLIGHTPAVFAAADTIVDVEARVTAS